MSDAATRVVSRNGQEVRLLRACTLTVELGADEGLRVRVTRPLFRVGTHESNDLVLRDETVSRHHLELQIVPEGYRVTDLDSSNGIFLGSARLREGTLAEPTTLQLGHTRLRLEPTSDEAEVPASPRTRFGRAVGRSIVMRELFEQLEAASRSDCSVLLEGETGVGKELLAESLHEQSRRAHGPFVVVDCAALPHNLLEAELFGWTRGAFTDADEGRRGLLESANGGTVFLDAVDELPRPLQARLLGALERRRVTPLGAAHDRPIDVRVIASARRHLAREVNQGRFRSDLFYRLAVLRLVVPPLRDRLEDIPLLVERFLQPARGRRRDAELSAVALARLATRPWPGNVRELRNAVERALLDLPELRHRDARPANSGHDGPFELFAARDLALERFERRYFREVLACTDGNMSHAARLAGMDRRYLYRVLDRLGLRRAA